VYIQKPPHQYPRREPGVNGNRKLISLVSLVVSRDGWDAAEVSVFDAVAVTFELR
jgi:hypothetical protein